MRGPKLLLCVFAILIAAVSTGCSSRSEIVPKAEFAPYITAYTGGIVSAGSTIRVQLAQPVSGVELNAPVKDKLFRFSPSLKGKAYWIDNTTVEFVPEEGALKEGKLYNASFNIGRVIQIEKGLETFEFSFRVQERDFSLEVMPAFVSQDKPGEAVIGGTLLLSEPVRAEDVAALLSMDGVGVPAVEPEGEGTRFTFTFGAVGRTGEQQTLTVKADGHKVKIDKIIEQQVVIPALEPFVVLDARLVSHPEYGIQVTFSDPLDPLQDMQGLVELEGVGEFVTQTEDNRVTLFFERGSSAGVTLNVDRSIRNAKGGSLGESHTFSFVTESLKPAVELPFPGSIMPDAKNLILPFRAVNLRAVDVRVIQIYENNVLMFLQTNTLGGSDELRRSGRLVFRKTLRLDGDISRKPDTWQEFRLDLSELVNRQKGAIYNIQFSFKRDYSTYPCGDAAIAQAGEGLVKLESGGTLNEEEEAEWDRPQTYYWSGDDYNWDEYNWRDRDNPCKPTYYMLSERRVECNVLASNLGLIVKSGTDRKLNVVVTDIVSAKPAGDATVTAYNFQLQPLGEGKTDSEGFTTFDIKGVPFVVVASSGGYKTYLRVTDNEQNQLTRFDVGGKRVDKGLKGFAFGERGVWRPGDTIHLGFILERRGAEIPENHPVTMEVFNPRGQFYTRQVTTLGKGLFCRFDIPTHADDPTGVWNGYIKVGGATFHKSLRVETIKPNRLKIDLSLPADRIDASKGDFRSELSSRWLMGATARGLKASVEMTLNKVNTQFAGYDSYSFNNPASEFSSSSTDIFSGSLSDEGKASFNFKVPAARNAPGMLRADIVCQVMEPGGDVSIYNRSIPFSPFASYVGLNVNQKRGSWMETDKDYSFDVVTLTPAGKPVPQQGLEYKIYKLNWNWWWDSSPDDNLDSYVNSGSVEPVKSGTLSTASTGKGSIGMRIDYPDWGRYLVYVRNPQSGHATGQIVYVDWPSWRGRSEKSDPSGVTMLTFSTDKTSYSVGETVTAMIPTSPGGRALVSLENGSRIISKTWVDASSGSDTKYTFKVTADMAPNFYIHISLLQPHGQTANSLPIRLYGVLPVEVTNKNSELKPVITMPEVLRPEKSFTLKVTETSGKPMNYMVAIVDEGLLDLTNFRTPNPRNEFLAREALGVRTWDMFDAVIGALGAKTGSLLGIGGGDEMNPGGQRANRFKPVSIVLGPFSLGRGSKNEHKITLPMYVGSVRAMVVAAGDGAYGCAEKAVPVRSPLMILPTLPRTISVTDKVSMPVNVFAMEPEVKNVTVRVETTGLLKATAGASRSVPFPAPGDKIVTLPLEAGPVPGVERVKITASCGNITTVETIEIEIRNPNPPVTSISERMIAPGASVSLDIPRSEGNTSESWSKLDLSRMPSVDLSRRYDFLDSYSHYCSEQITSKAFPLLYASTFRDLSKQEEESVKKNVREAIRQLYSRQLPGGGFTFWPGHSDVNDWVTSYAGNFLLEAREHGYEVNGAVIDRWKNYQRRAAQSWVPAGKNNTGPYRYYLSDLSQAYRLYTLALASAPEMGAMNRMKEGGDVSVQALWRLSAAYAVVGKTKVARELVWNAKTTVETYGGNDHTYGSPDRDVAMILETMVLTGDLEGAMKQARTVSENLGREEWFSTQSTAFSLVAMGRLASKLSPGAIDVEWAVDSKQQKAIKSARAGYQTLLPSGSSGNVVVSNEGKGEVFASLTSKYTPLVDNSPALARNLTLEVAYSDLAGRRIDPSRLAQGTEFTATVTVVNTGGTTDYRDMALTHIMPSGWEIYNDRMAGSAADDGAAVEEPDSGTSRDRGATKRVPYTYRDIRDDRVMTYFDLKRGERKQFAVRLQAVYAGSYIMPAVQCEAMYDPQTVARTAASHTEVVAQ